VRISSSLGPFDAGGRIKIPGDNQESVTFTVTIAAEPAP
jgi:hypothetical protein